MYGIICIELWCFCDWKRRELCVLWPACFNSWVRNDCLSRWLLCNAWNRDGKCEQCYSFLWSERWECGWSCCFRVARWRLYHYCLWWSDMSSDIKLCNLWTWRGCSEFWCDRCLLFWVCWWRSFSGFLFWKHRECHLLFQRCRDRFRPVLVCLFWGLCRIWSWWKWLHHWWSVCPGIKSWRIDPRGTGFRCSLLWR